MSGPWDKYASAPAGDGPWAKYGATPAEPDRSNEIPKLHDDPPGPAAPKQGLLDKVRETINGAPEAITSAVTGTAGALAGNLAGAARTVTSGKFGTQEGISEGMKTADKVAGGIAVAPKSEAGQATAQRVGDLLKPLEGLPPHLAMPTAGKLAGAGASATERGAQATAGKLAGALVDPDRGALARRAQDMGISIRPDMLSDNRFVRMLGEALDKVPLSGSQSEQRQVAFNRALMGQIGVDLQGGAKRITPSVFDAAMTKSGSTIGDIAARTPVKFDEGFATKMGEFVTEADRYQPSDIAKAVTNYADELKRAAAANGGVIPGETFRKIDSKLGRQWRTTSNGDLKYALGDFQELMHDALETSLAPGDSAALKEARRQYAIGKTIEPLVAKSKNGDVSPAGLMQAMTSDKGKKTMMARGRAGEMGELARIGQMFLKEPESSGSAERLATYGAIGGGAYIEPHTAAGVYAGANLYNRLGPRATKWALGREPEAIRPPMDEALTP